MGTVAIVILSGVKMRLHFLLVLSSNIGRFFFFRPTHGSVCMRANVNEMNSRIRIPPTPMRAGLIQEKNEALEVIFKGFASAITFYYYKATHTRASQS